MKILIIDDDMVQRMLLSRVLRELGCGPIIEAEDGEEGIQAYRQNNDVDLVITDYHLPLIDGIELIEHLRSQGSDTPIYLATGEECEVVTQAANSAGADGILTKPTTYQDFVTEFRTLVETVAREPIAASV